MSFAYTFSAQPHHLLGKIVSVEVDISKGLHTFTIIGLASRAVDEARDRVSSALKNSGYPYPKSRNEKLVISLAPAELKKDGAYHDLAIALAYLLALDEISFNPEDKIFLGELSLDGRIKPLVGILPLVQSAHKEHYKEIFVPFENRVEAALVSGIEVYPVKNLSELIDHLNLKGESKVKLSKQEKTIIPQAFANQKLMSQIRGQDLAKRGLEIAATGGHNVMLYGPPGTGKTMLARAFTDILPPLSEQESLEVTGIHSISGALHSDVISRPPFRSPHHSSSYAAILGGGVLPKPGEITLAHRGVLFLDEFPEFEKRVIESLRQPLEDRWVDISRANSRARFPSSFILIAAMNPCPCGFYGSTHKVCNCNSKQIISYQKKISGPIADRIDIWLSIEHISYDTLLSAPPEDNYNMKESVHRARLFSTHRSMNTKTYNAHMNAQDIENEILSEELKLLLQKSAQSLNLSPRSFHRLIKISRTIADLDQSPEIKEHHLLEALQYRSPISSL